MGALRLPLVIHISLFAFCLSLSLCVAFSLCLLLSVSLSVARLSTPFANMLPKQFHFTLINAALWRTQKPIVGTSICHRKWYLIQFYGILSITIAKIVQPTWVCMWFLARLIFYLNDFKIDSNNKPIQACFRRIKN